MAEAAWNVAEAACGYQILSSRVLLKSRNKVSFMPMSMAGPSTRHCTQRDLSSVELKIKQQQKQSAGHGDTCL